ncbi:CDP-diacylglycerol--glycerol-3-phosphate 3-phosphatidyltransferase [Schaalia sp. 19OD2882]|uniref:CDP-diacylglycerol--glycerol-3-phosphate 3-phosphatidyltransferase n=1 Tax=Schaalia sp. 19OD2882 TaxID=2794089 RepID=UPI001C1F146F|nr:CDP-diacylglycerol--glycerol-3-phosphate 3-phosphatidyltransferase [Schaalia sp. 19OD2882]QWW18964.1 CDP-diacylglycerol--glycerol-3-phosphate 3-phosphatidyltransferase [Schaalia sp. 19OD2882]
MGALHVRGGSTDPAGLVNLPNFLTVLRLLLVPVFIWLMLQPGTMMRWAALGVFILASLTDFLDGQIARAQGLVTDFGKIVDPIADKALTLGAFVMLSLDTELSPWWVTILVAVRELGITLMRMVLLRRGVVVAANAGGKLKTVLQMAFIIALLVPWGALVPRAILEWIALPVYILGGVMVAVTVWSGLVYVLEVWKSSRGRGAADQS